MKVTLCSVPTETPGFKLRRLRSDGPHIAPKIAITSLNHWAEKNGFPTCKFYDIDMLYPTDEEVEKYFKENPADVIGLSAVVSTSYLQAKRLSKIIKKVNKNTIIVCGGYLTAAANTILRKTEVDICVVGDGEIAWVGILKFMKDHLKTGKNKLDIDKLLEVKGIAILDDYKNLKFSGYGQRLQSSQMSFTSFEYLKTGLQGNDEMFKNYFKPFNKNPEAFMMDDRSFEKDRRPMVVATYLTKGCVAKCTFCQRGSKGYSVYDPDKLDSHLKSLRDDYNVGFVAVDDENFASNMKHAYEVARVLNKYNMLWGVLGVRCNGIKKEDLAFFKKMGMSYMKFGIESGSQTMLDIMEKKFTVEDIKKAIFACHELDIHSPLWGFMIGMPGESLKTARESGELMGILAANLRVPVDLIWGNTDIAYTIPLIGTPLYEYGQQIKILGKTVDDEEEYLKLTSNVASYKRYYINLNGAPMSEVVFWDNLIFLEATRTYEKLMKGKEENKELKNKYIKVLEIKGLNPQVRAKQRKIQVMGAVAENLDISFDQYFITNFLKQHIIFNKKIAKLPRFLVYPTVRYMLYFEYLIQKYFFKDEHNLHRTANSKVKSSIRIKESKTEPSKTTQKDRSLRTMVTKKMAQFHRTEQEKLSSTLTGGP